MLRTNNSEYRDPFEHVFAPEVFELNQELKTVGELLNNPNLMKPFQERFGTKIGRTTVPVSSYLRIMYLKDRYQMGYESLVEEINKSLLLFCN